MKWIAWRSSAKTDPVIRVLQMKPPGGVPRSGANTGYGGFPPILKPSSKRALRISRTNLAASPPSSGQKYLGGGAAGGRAPSPPPKKHAYKSGSPPPSSGQKYPGGRRRRGAAPPPLLQIRRQAALLCQTGADLYAASTSCRDPIDLVRRQVFTWISRFF